MGKETKDTKRTSSRSDILAVIRKRLRLMAERRAATVNGIRIRVILGVVS